MHAHLPRTPAAVQPGTLGRMHACRLALRLRTRQAHPHRATRNAGDACMHAVGVVRRAGFHTPGPMDRQGCRHACRLGTGRSRKNGPRSGPSQTPQPHPISPMPGTQIVERKPFRATRRASSPLESHARRRARAERTPWRAHGAGVAEHRERGGAPMHARRPHEQPTRSQIPVRTCVGRCIPPPVCSLSL